MWSGEKRSVSPVVDGEVLSVEDFHALVDVNLNGTFHFVHAVLPVMRKQGEVTIVNVVSDAGLIANAKAGAAYLKLYRDCLAG